MKKVGLYLNTPDKIVGCWKLSHNLMKGFEKLKIPYEINKPGDVNGCIHGAVKEYQEKTLPKNTVVGPEIMVLPSEQSWAFQNYNNWVQPSQWVVDYFETFPITKNAKFNIWECGIDTDKFNEEGRGNWKYDCFIYYKDVTHQVSKKHLNSIEKELKQRNLTYTTINYGSYKENDLIRLTKQCKFGIFLTGTESQGIAYQECLSSGVPLFVIDVNEFKYKSYKFTNENVSAAPYFDERCGIKAVNFSFYYFDIFLSNLEKYQPRDYILENLTIEKSTKKYYKILCEAR